MSLDSRCRVIPPAFLPRLASISLVIKIVKEFVGATSTRWTKKIPSIKFSENRVEHVGKCCNALYDLPNDIIAMILIRLNPKDAVRLAAVCKEWMSAVGRRGISIKNTPWLLVSARTPSGDARYLLLKASDSGATSMEIKITGIQDNDLCIGTHHGWLALKNRDFQEADHVRLSLLNPLSGARIDLPVVDDAMNVTQLHLSSAPVTPGCVAIAKGKSNRDLLLWRPGDGSWFDIRLPPEPMTYGFNRRLVNLMTIRGNLYVLNDTKGTWATTDSGRRQCFLYRDLPRPEANVTPRWTSHSKHLVESAAGGELWYVMICRDEVRRAVSNSFVFRWRPETRTWSEVERLDGAAMLLDGNRLVAVSARETGCRENCIYIAGESPAVAWTVYDRKDHIVTYDFGLELIPDSVSEAFWITMS